MKGVRPSRDLSPTRERFVERFRSSPIRAGHPHRLARAVGGVPRLPYSRWQELKEGSRLVRLKQKYPVRALLHEQGETSEDIPGQEGRKGNR